MGKKKISKLKTLKIPEDIEKWWNEQENSSEEVRKAIRFYIKYKDKELDRSLELYEKFHEQILGNIMVATPNVNNQIGNKKMISPALKEDKAEKHVEFKKIENHKDFEIIEDESDEDTDELEKNLDLLLWIKREHPFIINWILSFFMFLSYVGVLLVSGVLNSYFIITFIKK